MTSPIYYHPWIYERVMRLLYRNHYRERIQAVAEAIPPGSSVADICAGDCSLLRYGLHNQSADYHAYDINPRFVRWAKKRGIPMKALDIRINDIPFADCVVMLSSLYQFIPQERKTLEKLLLAAKRRVILAEPIHNVAQSRNPLMRWAGRTLTKVGDNPCAQRFDEETLRALLAEYGIQTLKPIAGGRELLAIHLTGEAHS
jgi:hypothetical protein